MCRPGGPEQYQDQRSRWSLILHGVRFRRVARLWIEHTVHVNINFTQRCLGRGDERLEELC